jgi:hypothetical protein
MARSYSIQFTGANGSTSYHQLMIYMATAAGVRPKIFEFSIGASGTPADYASRFLLARSSTAAPTGGAAPTVGPLDFADPAALASAYDAATGGETMSTVLYMVSVNQRATYRWIAAPGKEFLVPNTQYAGLGLQIAAQSTAYNTDLSLLWEE